jgi:hypothetical protein
MFMMIDTRTTASIVGLVRATPTASAMSMAIRPNRNLRGSWRRSRLLMVILAAR